MSTNSEAVALGDARSSCEASFLRRIEAMMEKYKGSPDAIAALKDLGRNVLSTATIERTEEDRFQKLFK